MYDHFNDAVKCILIRSDFDAPSRFRKGWMISIQKKYFDKKTSGLENW